jgi:hypothetical protein
MGVSMRIEMNLWGTEEAFRPAQSKYRTEENAQYPHANPKAKAAPASAATIDATMLFSEESPVLMHAIQHEND